jgi:hypothetical protein
VSNKSLRQFSRTLGIWTKLCVAVRTLIVARKSPVAILGSGKVRDRSHVQVYAFIGYGLPNKAIAGRTYPQDSRCLPCAGIRTSHLRKRTSRLQQTPPAEVTVKEQDCFAFLRDQRTSQSSPSLSARRQEPEGAPDRATRRKRNHHRWIDTTILTLGTGSRSSCKSRSRNRNLGPTPAGHQAPVVQLRSIAQTGYCPWCRRLHTLTVQPAHCWTPRVFSDWFAAALTRRASPCEPVCSSR